MKAMRDFEKAVSLTAEHPGFGVDSDSSHTLSYRQMGHIVWSVKVHDGTLYSCDQRDKPPVYKWWNYDENYLRELMAAPHYTTADVVFRNGCVGFLLAPEVFMRIKTPYVKMVARGEPCKIVGRRIKYSIDETKMIFRAQLVDSSFATKLASVIRGHPDLYLSPHTHGIRMFGHYFTSLGDLVTAERDRVKVNNLFELRYEYMSWEEAEMYLYRLQCAFNPPLCKSKPKRVEIRGQRFLAFPNLLFEGYRIVAPGEEYTWWHDKHRYSFDNFPPINKK